MLSDIRVLGEGSPGAGTPEGLSGQQEVKHRKSAHSSVFVYSRGGFAFGLENSEALPRPFYRTYDVISYSQLPI